MKTPLLLSICCLFAFLLQAQELTPELMRSPSAQFARPGSTFRIKSTGEEALFQALRELDRAREIGVGTVLFTLPREDERFWPFWRKITQKAQQLKLQIGFTDFSLKGETSSAPIWTASIIGTATNLSAWVRQNPSGSSNELARIARAEDGERLISLPSAENALPTQGVWRVTSFRRQIATNEVSVPFQSLKFGTHINSILSKSQTEIARQYDITVKWFHFPSATPAGCFWPFDGTAAHQPTRYWQWGDAEHRWETTPFFDRQSSVLWQESYAGIIRDLVQEAGLEASMDAAFTPIPPEELSTYFKRPLFSLAVSAAERERNLGVASGGRIMDRPKIIGRLPWPLPPSETGPLHTFSWKPFADSLLADGATHILLDLPNGLPADDQLFREFKLGCEYLHRCQRLLELGSHQQDYLLIGKIPPSLLERYSIDRMTPAMLQGVRIKNRELIFPSGWSYRRLLVDPDELRRNPGLLPKLLRFSRAGLPVAVCCLDGERTPSSVQGLQVVRSLSEFKLPPKVTVRSDNAKLSLRWIHKQTGKQGIYFLVNASDQSGNLRITFRNPAKKIIRWNPEGTEIQSLPVDHLRSCLFFMEPAESLFLIVE